LPPSGCQHIVAKPSRSGLLPAKWDCMGSHYASRPRRIRGDQAMTADPNGSTTTQARPATVNGPRRAWRTTLPAVAQAAGLARRATRDTLAAWSIGHLEETATLLVSELVGNAIRHATADRLGLELRLEASAARLRIEVHASDPQPPQPRTPAELDESGFGFILVEALADKWGVC